MLAALSPIFSHGAALRRRAVPFALALGAHILIVLLLLMLAPRQRPPPEIDPPPNTFQMLPTPAAAPQPAPRAAAPVKRSSSAAAPSPASPAALATVQPTAVPPIPVPTPPTLLPGGLELFEAADIGKLPAHRGEGAAVADAASGRDSGAVYGPGEGPGGQRLFNAEWQREPTDAELAGYLPGDTPRGGWAIIACRTVEDYRVENCRMLAESPAGSGLARALRLAAWQFRVLPPRVGGRKLIGAWVRIRVDFSEAAKPK